MKTIPRLAMRSKKVLTSPIMSNLPLTSSGDVSNYPHHISICHHDHEKKNEAHLEIPHKECSTRFLLSHPLLNHPSGPLTTTLRTEESIPRRTWSRSVIILSSSTSRSAKRSIIVVEIPSVFVSTSSGPCWSIELLRGEGLMRWTVVRHSAAASAIGSSSIIPPAARRHSSSHIPTTTTTTTRWTPIASLRETTSHPTAKVPAIILLPLCFPPSSSLILLLEVRLIVRVVVVPALIVSIIHSLIPSSPTLITSSSALLLEPTLIPVPSLTSTRRWWAIKTTHIPSTSVVRISEIIVRR